MSETTEVLKATLGMNKKDIEAIEWQALCNRAKIINEQYNKMERNRIELKDKFKYIRERKPKWLS